MQRVNVFRSRFFWKLYLTYSILFLAVSGLVGTVISFQIKSALTSDLEESLFDKITLIEPFGFQALKGNYSGNLQRIVRSLGTQANSHITVISKDGIVIADSHIMPGSYSTTWENSEVQASLGAPVGRSKRISKSSNRETIYLAKAVVDNNKPLGVIRIGYPTDRLTDRLRAIQHMIAGVAVGGIVLALILGMILARRVTGPITEMVQVADAMREGNYHKKVTSFTHDEIGLLGDTLNRLGGEITKKIAQISLERAQLKTMLAGVVEGIVAISDDNQVQFCNRAAYDLLESSLDDCRGLAIGELEGFNLLTPVVIEAREKRELIESELKLGKKGSKRSLELHASAYKGEQASGVIVVLHDVTKVKRLERVRRDFIANVSHEIKTPLTTIKGYTETILAGAIEDKENLPRFIDKIDKNASRLVELVHDTLSLTRIESEEEAIHNAPTDWRPVINQVLSRYDDLLLKKDLEIKTNYSEVPVVVMGDRDAMQHVFDNLLTNAIRYTPEHGKVQVKLSQKGNRGILEVEDTGIGIPKKQLSRVFERFYRVDKARSQELGGTGLGLAIVKHLVTGMNGRVKVESEVGSGSRFTVYLNLVT